MTDTATPTDMRGLYEMLFEALKELDVTIDSWNPETGARNNFLAELVAENAETSSAQVNKLSEQLSAMDERKRYSLYHGLVEGLRSSFKKDFDTWVNAQVESLPKPEAVQVSEEERKEITTKRSGYYQKIKQVKELAESIGFPGAEDWAMPTVRRAGSGKRGKRALSLYTWAIDGEEVSGDDNTPAGVAKLLGFDKAGDFTKALKEQTVTDDEGKNSTKLNTSKPPHNFEVTIRGRVVTASRITDDDVDDSDEDDDDNGDED